MAVSQRRLLLASDVDETLLRYDERLGGPLLSVITGLLASDSVVLAIITGNDYVSRQMHRVVEPIPVALRHKLVVYADGCTRKLTFASDGTEVLDEAYWQAVAFDPLDKARVVAALQQRMPSWCEVYPALRFPSVRVAALRGAVEVTVGPLREDESVPVERRDELRAQMMAELEPLCSDVTALPSAPIWARVRCGAIGPGVDLEDLRDVLERLMAKYPDLSSPEIIDRQEQLALKPVQPRLRPELVRQIDALLNGPERLTRHEYSALIGGRVTIDIQRAGVDKAHAIKDLMKTTHTHGEVLYLGDSFGPTGNDRPVAAVEGVTCLNVGPPEEALPGVIDLGGGPEMAFIYLRGILWALTGRTV
jgi:hydroxymethylpyrimidine pyrophosphatase-like HAD family hydrolase